MFNTSSNGIYSRIHPEDIKTLNAGVDFSILKGKISGGADLYYNNTSDIIGKIYLPFETNLNNSIITNTHNAIYRGVESFLNFRLINTPHLQWQVGTSLTYMKNKVLLNDPQYRIGYGSVNESTGNNVLVHAHNSAPGSFNIYINHYDQNGNPIEGLYLDLDKNNQIDYNDTKMYHSAFPSYYGTIHSSLQWKQWNFSFSGRAMKNNYVYNNTASVLGNYSSLYRPYGPYLSNMVTGYYNFTQPVYPSSYYVQDASFFRMDYIGLSYRFNTGSMKRFERMELTAGVQNAFVLTPYKGLDPEVPSGIDYDSYARPRTFFLAVSVNF
jgi:TonB-dependent starch-binding outer membrane protein SusC